MDSATIVPVASLGREFSTARAIRPRLLEALPHHLHRAGTTLPRVRRRIDVPFDSQQIGNIPALAAACAIDHAVLPSPGFRGGPAAAQQRVGHFLQHGLAGYDQNHGDPLSDSASGLSPYLHFGNISPQEVLLAVREAAPEPDYVRFQDQLLTWRELSFNFAYHNRRHRGLGALPAWAQKELDEHAGDPRTTRYSARQLESANTGEELWNAAQRAYLRDGYMHNYMRMLWGKSVLQWTATPARAFAILEHLNNKYALDGRGPNAYSGIMWIFGKFDRPFYGRPVYGLVRYMSLKAARKKFDTEEYIRRHPAVAP